MIEQFAESRLSDPQLLAFMDRIRIEPAPELDALGNPLRYAMRMTVTTLGGRRFERSSNHRPGSPEQPLTPEQLQGKFRLLARHVLPEERIAQVLEQVSVLERLGDVRDLIQLLVPPS